MRSYIRHPSDIPIKVDVHNNKALTRQPQLNDVSYGGLAFTSVHHLEPGSVIEMTISMVDPEFTAEGIVTYCREQGEAFVVGIEFIHRDDLFVARMVEQVCHIEHYKREIARKEGRRLSGEQAAREWIARYAETFPQWKN